MGEEQTLLLVRMIASEFGYTVTRVQFPKSNREVEEALVLEQVDQHFYSFTGINKCNFALEWLRRKV